MLRAVRVLVCLLSVYWPLQAFAGSLNGFDLSGGLVPEQAIRSGGPPRDGIPALTAPKFVQAKRARFLKPSDRVIGVSLNGKSKAYPIRILNWHEIVNDELGGQAIVVTYCPLCGTGMVFDARVGGRHHTFGVSGLLYQSDVLLYDQETESLWSQLKMQAVTGKRRGRRLTLLPVSHTTWEAWQKRHPNTLVLSTKTGFLRSYSRKPYVGYDSSRDIYFPISNLDKSYHPKTWTFAIRNQDKWKLYPFPEVVQRKSEGNVKFTDKVNGIPFRIHIDPSSRQVTVTDTHGNIQPVITGYWFALRVFYPEAEVFNGL